MREGAVRGFSQGILSAGPIISGTSQFPNPPSIIYMTINRIITNAWAVTATLWISSSAHKASGWPSSARLQGPGRCPPSQLKHQMSGAGCQRPCGLVECQQLVSRGGSRASTGL